MPHSISSATPILSLDLNPSITKISPPVPLQNYKITSEFTEGTNVLGLVMFSVVLGACIGKMREAGKPLQGLFETLSEAMMIITSWVIWISPIGVFFLVAAKLLEMASFVEVLGQLGWYFMTVMLGLMLHGFGKLHGF